MSAANAGSIGGLPTRFCGTDVDAALEFVGRFASTNDVLAGQDPASHERALERLREALGAHHARRGVWFDSRAWIVNARRGDHRG